MCLAFSCKAQQTDEAISKPVLVYVFICGYERVYLCSSVVKQQERRTFASQLLLPAREPLFLPYIGAVVIPGLLPEAQLVLAQELQPAQPLGALP